jgi:hypothetical protein
MARCSSCLALALFLALAAPLHVAMAADDPEEVALETFRDAKKLYDLKQYKAALAKFQQTWKRSQSPNARLYIARCYRALGDNRSAYDELAGTLRDAAGRADKDPRYVDTRNAAAAELVLLEPKVARLIVTLDEAAAKARVTLDNKPLEPNKIGEPITVAPGTHDVTAEQEGKKTSRKVSAVAGKTVAVGLWFDERAPAPQPTKAKGLADEEEFSGLQKAGIVLASLSGAVLVAGAISGAIGASKVGEIEDLCTTQGCKEPEFSDTVNTANILEIVTYIGVSVGIAGVMAGLAMTLLGRDEEKTAVVVVPVPGGAVVGVGGKF